MALRREGSQSKVVCQELVSEFMERLGMSEAVRTDFGSMASSFDNLVCKFAVGHQLNILMNCV